MRKRRNPFRSLLLAALLLSSSLTVSFQAFGETAVTAVEYENLRELLKEGNLALTESQASLEASVKPYREMYQILKEEQENMEDMSDSYEDDGDEEMAALYESNAEALKKSAGQINVTIQNMTSYSVMKSLEEQADACTVTAQTLMNSYNQMKEKVRAQEKSAEASEAAYKEAVSRQAAGLIKDSELQAAKESAEKAKNTLASLKEQEEELKDSLLLMLGMPDDADAEIGTIPEPDLEAIRSIDIEKDRETAVINDSAVFSARRASAKGTDERALRDQKVETAEAESDLSILSSYQDVQAALLQYEASLQSYEAARKEHEALLRKQQAGMLSNTEYLQGEAQFVSAESSKNIAAMSLYQAYESYMWEVKGVI